MPILSPPFAPGTYAGNSRGATFLSRAVTPTTFRGPPVVGVFRGVGTVTDATPGLPDLVAFAEVFDAPLVVLDDNAVPPGSYLLGSCVAAGRFYDSGQSQLPVYTDGLTTAPTAMCGPFVAVGTSLVNVNAAVYDLWHFYVRSYTRTSQNHPYLLGMHAVSVFTFPGAVLATAPYKGGMAPPIYFAGPTDVAGDLGQLRKRWLGEAVTTASQYEALLAAEALGRPGLARLVNACLVPYVQLTVPV